jgi:hypothetical protein
MSKKTKSSDFENITLSNDKKALPLTVLGLMKSDKKATMKTSFSSFYNTDSHYSLVFHKPISKIFSHINE